MPSKEGKQWRGQVVSTDSKGKRHRKAKMFSTKKEAKDWEAETRKTFERIETDQALEAIKRSAQRANIDIGSWVELHLDDMKATVRYKTYDEKVRAFRRLFAADLNPNMAVSSLTRTEAEYVFREASKNMSASSHNRLRKNVLRAWNWGIEQDLVPDENPFGKIKRKKRSLEEIEKYERYVPPIEDFEKVLAIADPEELLILLFCLVTAARKIELERLRWADVDFKKGTIKLTTRKTSDYSERVDTLALASKLQPLLKDYKKQAGRQDKVFFHHRMVKYNHNRHLKKLCIKAKVKPFGIYGIRHMAATEAVLNGIDILHVQMQLRHSDIRTTMRYIKKVKKAENLATNHLDSMAGNMLDTLGKAS